MFAYMNWENDTRCSPSALGLGPSSLCLSLQIMSLIFSLSFEGIWLALPTAPFFSKTLSSAGSPAFLISPPLPPYSCFTLIDLAARHQITQFCPSPLNYLDAASYANDVLYRISLFLFSLSPSLQAVICAYTPDILQPGWIWHMACWGDEARCLFTIPHLPVCAAPSNPDY